MCLAVPAVIVDIKQELAVIEVGGVRREVSVILVPEAKVGDYVLVHAGYAIQVVDEGEAQATLDLLRKMADRPWPG